MPKIYQYIDHTLIPFTTKVNQLLTLDENKRYKWINKDLSIDYTIGFLKFFINDKYKKGKAKIKNGPDREYEDLSIVPLKNGQYHIDFIKLDFLNSVTNIDVDIESSVITELTLNEDYTISRNYLHTGQIQIEINNDSSKGKWYFIDKPDVLYASNDVLVVNTGIYEIGFTYVSESNIKPNNITVEITKNTLIKEIVTYNHVDASVTVNFTCDDENPEFSSVWWIENQENILYQTGQTYIFPTIGTYTICYAKIFGYKEIQKTIVEITEDIILTYDKIYEKLAPVALHSMGSDLYNGALGHGSDVKLSNELKVIEELPATFSLPIKKLTITASSVNILTEDGNFYTCGEVGDAFYESNVITHRMSNVVDFKNISYHSFIFLKDNGYVYVLGFNTYGELCVGNRSRVTTFQSTYFSDGCIDISLSDTHSVVLKNDGYVYMAGRTAFGIMGEAASGDLYLTSPRKLDRIFESPVKQVVSLHFATILLLENGDVYGTGDRAQCGFSSSKTSFTKIPELSNVQRLWSVADGYATIALTTTGQIFRWGGSTTAQRVPSLQTVLTNANIVDFYPGVNYMIMKSSDNKLYGLGTTITYIDQTQNNKNINFTGLVSSSTGAELPYYNNLNSSLVVVNGNILYALLPIQMTNKFLKVKIYGGGLNRKWYLSTNPSELYDCGQEISIPETTISCVIHLVDIEGWVTPEPKFVGLQNKNTEIIMFYEKEVG